MKIRLSIIALIWSFTAVSNAAFAGELHVFTSDAAGFNTHSVWYDDGKEVTVVDSQFTPAHADALVAEIKKQSNSPITRIIVTHPNPDKFNALSVFHKEGADSIASAKTAAAIPGVDAYKHYFWVKIAKAFTDETYPKVEPVKTTYNGKKVINLKSGETITLFELKNPGVSSNQTVVRIDSTGDLIVGDLVHTKNHAWLEGGIVEGTAVPTIEGWKAALQELLLLGNGNVYGGRGEFVNVNQAVAQQTAYLDKANAIVDDYINELGTNVDELANPTKQAAHFAAIQSEFAKAYPDYAMADLIGYSVYGLVQQKLVQ
ncbi:MBL fold metallo-hydrolase [Vibrio navarrensis]|uniref:MBL fold metallo-hydrolase n=1 Tax=Vibrio navarrensis TaxID=29495 RepID=UPI0018674628|nr:MBL fold metallo-hydrolase [Vibrio navarrensis]MBE3659193.1 MBL fold metallo-hydrolase [Vibrio navarrensis]